MRKPAFPRTQEKSPDGKNQTHSPDPPKAGLFLPVPKFARLPSMRPAEDFCKLPQMPKRASQETFWGLLSFRKRTVRKPQAADSKRQTAAKEAADFPKLRSVQFQPDSSLKRMPVVVNSGTLSHKSLFLSAEPRSTRCSERKAFSKKSDAPVCEKLRR